MKTVGKNKIQDGICLYDEDCGEITYGHLLIDPRTKQKITREKVANSTASFGKGHLSVQRGISISA